MLKALIIFFLLPILFSFTFRPMSQTIDLSEGQKTTQFQVENNTSEMIPITIKVFERVQKENGKESLPNTKHVKVFPPQMIISPGEKKTVRVDWVGPNQLKGEKAYRIVAEQVPINVKSKSKKNRGGISMLLKYMNVLYVDPGGTKSNVVIKKFSNGETTKVYIENKGNLHQYFKNVSIKFVKGKQEIAIPQKDVAKLEGQNILAHTTRVFEFKLRKKIPNDFKGIITFDKK